MYTDFFKLQEKPFKLTPKASIFHDNSGVSTAYQSVIDAINVGERLILLTGETGTGKTLCAQRLIADIEPHPEFFGINIPFTSLPLDEIYGYICGELDLRYGLGQNENKLEILERFLEHGVSVVRSVVIVIDEAQNLAKGVFDGLADLIEIGERTHRDVQVVIMSRHESDLQLNQAHMARFNHLLTRRCHLKPLDAEDISSYVKYQLDKAGATYSDVFTEEAIKKIFQFTQGKARAINILCEHVMNVAANEKEAIITARHVETAHNQQRFDDTIEMNTSMISDAIERMQRESVQETIKEAQEVEPDHLAETPPDSLDNGVLDEIGSGEAPAASSSTEPLILTEETQEVLPEESELAIEVSPETSLEWDEKEVLAQVRYAEAHEEKKSFPFKLVLTSVVVISTISFLYYQLQQKKEAALEAEHATNPIEVPAQIVVNQPPKDKPPANNPVARKTDLANQNKEKQTTYLQAQDQHLEELNNSSKKTTKPLLNEDNGVVKIKSAPVEPPKIEKNDSDPEPIEQTNDSSIESILAIAEAQISELKLTAPRGDNAIESFNEILKIDPEHLEALEGIERVKTMFLNWTENNINRGNLSRAQNYLNKVLLIDPEHLEARQKLSDLEILIATQDKNVETLSGILGAAKDGDATTIKNLLDSGASANRQDSRGNTPLMLATDRGHLETVLTLLANGANPNIRNNVGDSALTNAVWNNRGEIAEQLIRKNIEINTANNNGWTALMYAALHGHLELFNKLLNNGANIESRTNDQKSALSIAAHNGQREIVSLLLQNGADANTTDIDGWAPLTHAVWGNHATVVQIVLLAGGAPNHQNSEGWTPLMLAAWNGRAPIVKMLLDNGADKSIQTPAGKTALDLAQEKQHDSIVTLLR